MACSAATYVLDWEVINLLLVMTSTQLYSPTATAQTNAHPFTSALLEQEDLVPALLQVHILPVPPILQQSTGTCTCLVLQDSNVLLRPFGVCANRRFCSTSYSGAPCRRVHRSISRPQTGSAASSALCAVQRVCSSVIFTNILAPVSPEAGRAIKVWLDTDLP